MGKWPSESRVAGAEEATATEVKEAVVEVEEALVEGVAVGLGVAATVAPTGAARKQARFEPDA